MTYVVEDDSDDDIRVTKSILAKFDGADLKFISALSASECLSSCDLLQKVLCVRKVSKML
jgi:hypothetical protein